MDCFKLAGRNELVELCSANAQHSHRVIDSDAQRYVYVISRQRIGLAVGWSCHDITARLQLGELWQTRDRCPETTEA